MGLFIGFHREAAAENVRQLHELANEVVGEPVLLSANAWIGSERHHSIIPHLTHIICEVPQHAAAGTEDLRTAISTYETATRFGKPLAGTASGHDWAHVAETGQHELIRFWVGLAYAHGQRFMVPHRQWCFNEEKGTHWHTFPIEEFAPMYHFIRDKARYFDGFEAVEGLQVEVPEDVLATVRRKGDTTVVHMLNRAYSEDDDRMEPQENVRLTLSADGLPESTEATLLAHDADSQDIFLEIVEGEAVLTVPELRGWTVVVFEPR